MQAKRERYTPADVGPTPKDWPAPYLRDVSSLITNGFVGTATPHYCESGGITYLYGTNVRENRIDLTGVRMITPEFHAGQAKTELQEGDLLTVQSGHIGTTAVVPKELEGTNCHALIVTRLHRDQVDPNFLSAYLNSHIGKARLRGLHVGSTILHINTKDLKRFRIPLPPLDEQKKIADILCAWDRAIEAVEKLVESTGRQKKSLMETLFRLGPNAQHSTPHVLGSLGTTYGGLTSKTKEDFGAGSPYVPYNNVFQNSRFDPKRIDHVKIAPGERQNAVRYGDILFTTSSETAEEVGMSSVVMDDVQNLYLNSFCFGFRLHDLSKLLPEYARYLMRSPRFRRKVVRLAQGSTRYNLSKTELLKLSIDLPSTEEQLRIARVLSTVDMEQDKQIRQLQLLRFEKDALMQQLLTGKRRVKVDGDVDQIASQATAHG